jgi:uncharacterized membrane protein (UPF0127 family)
VRILGFLFLLTSLIVGCTETSDAGSAGSGNKSRTTVISEMQTTREDTKTASEPAQASELRTVTIHTSSGKEVRVRAEIADDGFERARGLMYRTALAEDRGMLFIFEGMLFTFEEEQTLSFWMKNTLIPLSIAFIDSEGRIVDIQDMKPLDDDPPHYVSAEPARYALEVNQGFFEEHGVREGDRAELPV